MSRFQCPYSPTHVCDSGSTGSDTRLVPLTEHDTSLSTLEQELTQNRGEIWIQASTPNDLDGIQKMSVDVLQQIQGKLSKCRLTKVQEGMKRNIFNDLDKITDVLLTVLRAHQDAANGIRHILHQPLQGNIVPVVEGHLTAAWASIEKAANEFDGLRKTILLQFQSLREEADIIPGFWRRQAHKAVNRKLPEKYGYPIFCVAMVGVIVNSPAAPVITKRFPGAVAASGILGALAIILCMAMQAAKDMGYDAASYEPKARETTMLALDCIHKHLLQFFEMLSSLQMYWKDAHSTHIATTDNSDEELLQILETLEKHVDDCLVLINAIQGLSGSMIVFPTRLDIDDERNGITRGIFGLPSGQY